MSATFFHSQLGNLFFDPRTGLLHDQFNTAYINDPLHGIIPAYPPAAHNAYYQPMAMPSNGAFTFQTPPVAYRNLDGSVAVEHTTTTIYPPNFPPQLNTVPTQQRPCYQPDVNAPIFIPSNAAVTTKSTSDSALLAEENKPAIEIPAVEDQVVQAEIKKDTPTIETVIEQSPVVEPMKFIFTTSPIEDEPIQKEEPQAAKQPIAEIKTPAVEERKDNCITINNHEIEVAFVTMTNPKRKKQKSAEPKPASISNPNEKIFDFDNVRVKGIINEGTLDTSQVKLNWGLKEYEGAIDFNGTKFKPIGEGKLTAGNRCYTGPLDENFNFSGSITVETPEAIFTGPCNENLQLNGMGSISFKNAEGKKLEGSFTDGRLIGEGKMSWPDGKTFTGSVTAEYQPLSGKWTYPLTALPDQYAPTIGFSDTLQGSGHFNGDATWTGQMKGFANITLKGKSQQGLPIGQCSLETRAIEGKTFTSKVIFEPAGQPRTLILANLGTFTFFADGKTDLAYRNGDRYYGVVQNLLPNDLNGLHYIQASLSFILGAFSATNPSQKGTIDATRVSRVYQQRKPATPRLTELAEEEKTALMRFATATGVKINIDHCHLVYEGPIKNLDNSHYASSDNNELGKLFLPNENNEWYLCEHSFLFGYPQQATTIKKLNGDVSYTGKVSHGQIFGNGVFTNGEISLKGKFCLYQDNTVNDEIMIQEVTEWTGEEKDRPANGSLLKKCAPFSNFKPPVMKLVLEPTY